VAALGQTSLTLRWAAERDPNVTGYRLYWGPASGVYTNSVDVGSPSRVELEATVTVYGPLNYFGLTAYDRLGNESGYSNEIFWPGYVPPAGATTCIRITPQVASSPDGPWNGVGSWPPVTITNPPYPALFNRIAISDTAFTPQWSFSLAGLWAPIGQWPPLARSNKPGTLYFQLVMTNWTQ